MNTWWDLHFLLLYRVKASYIGLNSTHTSWHFWRHMNVLCGHEVVPHDLREKETNECNWWCRCRLEEANSVTSVIPAHASYQCHQVSVAEDRQKVKASRHRQHWMLLRHGGPLKLHGSLSFRWEETASKLFISALVFWKASNSRLHLQCYVIIPFTLFFFSNQIWIKMKRLRRSLLCI